MMRILCCNYEFPPVGGGGATVNYYLAREMVRAGHSVTVLTSGFRGLPKREIVEGIEVLRVPVRRERLDYTKLHEMLQYVLMAAPRAALMGLRPRHKRPDIVQTFFAVPSGLVGWWPSRLGRIPHVIRIGGGDLPGHEKRFGQTHRLLRPVLGCLLGGAAARIVNSHGLRQRARQLFPAVAFEVVYNGVDTDFFRPAESRCDAVPAVLFVSRLIERKGLQLLIEALAQLHREGVQFRLLVVGDGPMRSQLEQQVASAGLDDAVEFVGLIDRAELPQVYRQGDVFCLPSASEGMANVMLEAAATGLPIVTTDVPGTDELVDHGVNGFVIPKPDAGELVEPLRVLLTDAQMRRQFGQASRARSEQFAWDNMAAKYLDLYGQLLDAG